MLQVHLLLRSLLSSAISKSTREMSYGQSNESQYYEENTTYEDSSHVRAGSESVSAIADTTLAFLNIPSYSLERDLGDTEIQKESDEVLEPLDAIEPATLSPSAPPEVFFAPVPTDLNSDISEVALVEAVLISATQAAETAVPEKHKIDSSSSRNFSFLYPRDSSLMNNLVLDIKTIAYLDKICIQLEYTVDSFSSLIEFLAKIKYRMTDMRNPLTVHIFFIHQKHVTELIKSVDVLLVINKTLFFEEKIPEMTNEKIKIVQPEIPADTIRIIYPRDAQQLSNILNGPDQGIKNFHVYIIEHDNDGSLTLYQSNLDKYVKELWNIFTRRGIFSRKLKYPNLSKVSIFFCTNFSDISYKYPRERGRTLYEFKGKYPLLTFRQIPDEKILERSQIVGVFVKFRLEENIGYYFDGNLTFQGKCRFLPSIENIQSLKVQATDKDCSFNKFDASLRHLKILQARYYSDTRQGFSLHLEGLELLETLEVDEPFIRIIPPTQEFLHLKKLTLNGGLERPIFIGGDISREIEITGNFDRSMVQFVSAPPMMTIVDGKEK
jgi:hypothetical protein